MRTTAPLQGMCHLVMLTLDTDIVIFGGGIAGLWTLHHLRHLGYAALLLENGQLGDGQTLRSQGIIHGGMKYALSGILNAEAEAIAGMPERWRRALRGEGDVDLSGVRVLCDHHYMWSQSSLASRLTTFFGSKMLRGRIAQVHGDERPEALRDRAFKGSVYRLDDIVVDTHSLIETLAQRQKNHIYQISRHNCRIEADDQHRTRAIFITAAGTEPLRIHPRVVILAAGAGNRELLDDIGLTQQRMQLRPLHMVLMKHPQLPPLYAHCVGTSSKPRITITTHTTAAGETAWYLGGELAESGVERDARLQIDVAQREIHELFPWLDVRGAHWSTLRVDRAEPQQEQLVKPDHAYASWVGNNIICWPTKLALAPNLAEQISALLKEHQIEPLTPPPSPLPLPFPEIATPIWDRREPI